MKKLILILTMALTFVYPSNVTAQETIVDVAVGNKNFSTLVTALKAANLVTALQGDGPFTVFAPTNDAFAKIDSETLSSLLEEKNQKALANILTYHVVPGKLTATDVVAALKKVLSEQVTISITSVVVVVSPPPSISGPKSMPSPIVAVIVPLPSSMALCVWQKAMSSTANSFAFLEVV